MSCALALAVADAEQRGAARAAGPMLLADLLVSDGNLVLTPEGPDPRAAVVAAVCGGQPWPTDPVHLLGAEAAEREAAEMERTRRKIAEGALSMALVDGVIDPNLSVAELEDMRRRSGLYENRLAKRIKISRDKLAALSFRLWDGRTFAEERDLRAGTDANQQKRARVARDLSAELEQEIADGR